MKVFITGAHGFIGTAVTKELLSHGHTVTGLSRNDSTTAKLSAIGATAHPGDLENLDSLRSGAAQSDAVIHLAFHHQLMATDFARAISIDTEAVQAMGDAIARTGKSLTIASGTLICGGLGYIADEDTEPDRSNMLAARAKTADIVVEMSKKGVRGAVVRLPPTCHGKDDAAIVPSWIDISRREGKVVHRGDAKTRWPTAHILDIAVLFRLILEKGEAGKTYNAVAEEVDTKDIAVLIGKKLDVPVEGTDLEGLQKTLGFLVNLIGTDNPTSSQKTKMLLGWTPEQATLLDDMEAEYFETVGSSKYQSMK